MSQKRCTYISKCQFHLIMKLNRDKELPGYWKSDIYIAKLLEQYLNFFGPGQHVLSSSSSQVQSGIQQGSRISREFAFGHFFFKGQKVQCYGVRTDICMFKILVKTLYIYIKHAYFFDDLRKSDIGSKYSSFHILR